MLIVLMVSVDVKQQWASTPLQKWSLQCTNPDLEHQPQRIVQELCESRGGRPGLSVLTSLLVSVDVKIYCTVLRHWSQLVPNVSWHLRTLSITSSLIITSHNAPSPYGLRGRKATLSFNTRHKMLIVLMVCGHKATLNLNTRHKATFEANREPDGRAHRTQIESAHQHANIA